MKLQINHRDLELLSLYLDEQLTPAERQRLEKRLRESEALSLTLVEMRQTRMALRNMPRARSPRNFTLTPRMIGSRSPRRVYPVLGFVSALASFLFVLVLAGDLLGAFTRPTGSVAFQQEPMLEAAVPTMQSLQEKSVQAAPTSTALPSETQVMQAQVELKAAAGAADESTMQLNETLPPAPAAPALEVGETAAPALVGMYAKEAQAPDLGASEEISGTGEITTTEVIEKSLPPMTTPTGRIAADSVAPSPTTVTLEAVLTPSAPSQEEVTPEIPALAENFTQSEGLSTSPSESEEEPQVETGLRDQNRMLGEEDRQATAQSRQLILWILEGVFAGTALITGGLVFIQRRRIIR